MAKLYFRYSAMDAGKTLDLLKVAFNYQDRGQETLVFTSKVDKRSGENLVMSRIGFSRPAISTTINDNLYIIVQELQVGTKFSCILIDEIQFFSIEQINQLSEIVDYLQIPVICYGLRSNYLGEPFPTAAYLLAIADSIEELKTICHCGRKATYNMLVENGQVVKIGNPVVIDDDNLNQRNSRYYSVCRRCFKEGRYF